MPPTDHPEPTATASGTGDFGPPPTTNASAPPDRSAPPGATTALGPLERYRLLVLLGQGGMGEVWRALDGQLGRTVALKLLPAHRQPSSAALARFDRETRATAQLQHPNIVPIYDAGRLPDGRLFYTMKEVRGRTLHAAQAAVHAASRPDAWLPGPDGWTFLRLVDAWRQVCTAMAYAHDRGVLHRDLKPANVMLGAFGEVLVMDWGLVKVLDESDLPAEAAAPHPHLTRAGMGTAGFMSPEQARNQTHALGPTADVYALGAMLFTLLTGQRPPPPHAVPAAPPLPRIPRELWPLVRDAMAERPEDRPSDARVLATRAQQWLDGAREAERAGAAAEAAEQAWLALEPAQQPAAREALLRLLDRSGEATSRPAAALAPAPLDPLQAAGLVHQDGGAASLAEPALARSWSRLRGWAQAAADRQTLRLALADAAWTWAERGRSPALLWTGTELARARTQAAADAWLPAVERDFLAAATARERRRRRLLVGGLGLGLLALSVGLGAWWSDRQRSAAAVVAAERTARARLYRAEAALAENNDQMHKTEALLRASVAADPAATDASGRLETLTPLLSPLTWLTPHAGSGWSTAWRPQGDRIASVATDGVVRLHAWPGGAPVAAVEADGGLRGVAFDPTGRVLVAGGSPEEVLLLDGETGTRLRTLGPVPGGMNDADFSADGTRLLVSALGGEQVLFAVATGEELGRWTVPGWGMAARISPAGALLLSGSETDLRMLNPDLSPRWERRLDGALRNGLLVDERWVLVVTAPGDLVLLDAQTGQTLAERPGAHRSVVDPLTLLPDAPGGPVAVTGGRDRAVRAWRLPSLERLWEAPQLDESTWSLTPTPDGQHLLAATHEGRVAVLDLRSGTTLEESRVATEGVRHLATHPRQTVAAGITIEGAVFTWAPRLATLPIQTDCGQPLTRLQRLRPGLQLGRHRRGPWSCVLGPERAVALETPGPSGRVATDRSGTVVAGIDESGALGLWSTQTGQRLRSRTLPERPEGPAVLVGFSGETEVLDLHFREAQELWSVPLGGGPVERRPWTHSRVVPAVPLVRDHRRVLVDDEPLHTVVWDLATDERDTAPEWVVGLAKERQLSADGARLLLGQDDGGLLLVELDGGASRRLGQPTDRIVTVQDDWEGRWLVVRERSGRTELWNAETGARRALSHQAGGLVLDDQGRTLERLARGQHQLVLSSPEAGQLDRLPNPGKGLGGMARGAELVLPLGARLRRWSPDAVAPDGPRSNLRVCREDAAVVAVAGAGESPWAPAEQCGGAGDRTDEAPGGAESTGG